MVHSTSMQSGHTEMPTHICEHSSAIRSAFPFAVHLLCDMHMKDGASAKLTELGIHGVPWQSIGKHLFCS